MKTKIYLLIAMMWMVSGCKKDTDAFLTKLPLDLLTDEAYWSSEGNVRTFAYGFYVGNFGGYETGYFSWGGYFSGDGITDDCAPFVPAQYTSTVPSTSGSWSFTNIRKINLMVERVKTVPMPQEAIKNWTGVARFFRALEYASKVKTYGDFPWYGKMLDETDMKGLYKPRDPRTLVMDSVLADFNYAVANVRASDAITGPKGLIVNKAVVLAFMSRIFLYEGTYLKYHGINLPKATEYLTAAKNAASQLIASGEYSVSSDYRSLFNSLSLAGNSEIILYRNYETGLVTHALNTYVNKEAQPGFSKNLIDSYLLKDGLPISLSPLYTNDKTIGAVMANRDPRMAATFVNTLRLTGVVANSSSTGYAVHKFLNEAIKDLPEGNSNLNPTDAPVIRYGEVLMNFIEASAELGTPTQADLDNSINKLRKRTNINIPSLQVMGNQPAVNGVIYDDPKRDPTVSSLLWEIRRERRIELSMEGFRNADLRRWKKLENADTQGKDTNRGAWIKRSDYPSSLSVTIENNAAEGYIIPTPSLASQRKFTDPRVYLSPLGTDQIKLYQDNGAVLAQNPGW